MADLRSDIHTLGARVGKMEESTKLMETDLHRTATVVSSHSQQLMDMTRHLEDLDNRGSRYNIHLRGLPESVSDDQLELTLRMILNNLLERPPEFPGGHGEIPSSTMPPQTR